MKKLKILLFFFLIAGAFCLAENSQAAVLWQENFDGYSRDYLFGPPSVITDNSCAWNADQASSESVYCGVPSAFQYGKADTQGWGISGEAPYVHGINSSGARGAGKGWRLNLRAHPRTKGYDGENILKSKSFSSSGVNVFYQRWYMRESNINWDVTSYQKLFRIFGNSGAGQSFIPEWYAGRFRLWGRSGGVADWTNVNPKTYTDSTVPSGIQNQWVCYEIKYDIPAQTYQLWVNGNDKGVKTGSLVPTSERIVSVEVGGNQHNIGAWSPFTGYKTRDYDDIVFSDSRIGCDGTIPTSDPIPTPDPTPTTDTTPPTVTSFTLPSTSNSLTVPVTAFTATDDVEVTRYLITESSAMPTLSTTGATTTPSTSYTFSSEGTKTLYAWARDAAGNISASKSASVTITLVKNFSILDFTNLVSDWLKTTASASDINNDGTVNSRDLGIMMSKWAS